MKAGNSIQVVFALLVMLMPSCSSRTKTGAIAGQISGASDLSLEQAASSTRIPAIPNVNITIKNASTAAVRTAQTDSNGKFKVEGLPPGRYEVCYAARPFKPQVHRIDVSPGETTDASTRMLSGREIEDVVSISGCPARPVGGVLPPDVSSVEIQLRRTACYGRCPVYTVHLYADGHIEYRGYLYVSVLGTKNYHVEPSAVAALAKKFYEKGFFNLCTSYRVLATDQPTVETTIQIAGVTKTVSVYGNAAPEGLEDLDTQIEDVAHAGQFVKSGIRPE